MDRNHDGVVTIDEFLDCCRCDQAIKNSMLVFDSSFWPCENGVSGNSHLDPPSYDQFTSHSIPNAKSLYDDVNTNSHQHQLTTTMATSSGTFAGNKMCNNVGHKASQMRRIQLSTASKRCKSSSGNNPTAINNTHHDTAAAIATTDEDKSCQINVGDDVTSANNSTTQSTASPTLVRVKTWYTESSCGVLLPTALNIQEQHRHLPWYYFVDEADLWPTSSAAVTAKLMSNFYISCSIFYFHAFVLWFVTIMTIF